MSDHRFQSTSDMINLFSNKIENNNEKIPRTVILKRINTTNFFCSCHTHSQLSRK